MKHNPTTITNGIDEGELTDAYEEIGANEEIGETTNENDSGKLFFTTRLYCNAFTKNFKIIQKQ